MMSKGDVLKELKGISENKDLKRIVDLQSKLIYQWYQKLKELTAEIETYLDLHRGKY